MKFIHRISRSTFFIKLIHWEYWPFGVIQFPVFFYWLWCALRTRSFFFFSASNPSILMGGMLGESKFDVLSLVPQAVRPVTALVNLPATREQVIKIMHDNGLTLPVIFKPDLGERGWMVRKISTEQEIERYLSETRIDFLIQEFVNLPLEFGVFYVRYPNEPTGRVNSITMKEFLFVVGDGDRTLEQLILANDRAKLQWPVLQKTYAHALGEVLEKGKKLELVSIGNHCLGTKFLNGNHLITPQLSASFDRISREIRDFYFGRFDLRCASPADLEQGKVKIMELNGCGAEPAHIYHPGSSLLKAMRTLLMHWQDMYRISKLNHARGVSYIPFREGYSILKKFRGLNPE